MLRTALAFTAVGLIVVGLGWPSSQPARAAINDQINFQGRLLSAAGAVVADGNYNVEYKIYTGGTGAAAGDPGGALQWTEDWTNTGGHPVVVKNGYFSIMLGSLTALPSAATLDNPTVWLSMNVAAGANATATCGTFSACGGDGEMVPMDPFGAAPYAINSANSDALGGISSTGFIQNVATNLTQQQASINLLNPAANAALAGAELQQTGTATAPVLLLKGGATPGAGADLLQLQSSSAVVDRFDLSGNLYMATGDGIDAQTSAGTLVLGGTSSTTNATTIDLGVTGGATAQTINVASSANANTVNIATGAVTSGADSVTIGTASSGSGKDTIVIGSSNGNSTTTVEGGASGTIGTPSIAIGNGGANHVIEIGSNALSSNTIYLGSSGASGVVQTAAGAFVGTLQGSGYTLADTTNSTTALQVQNATGESVLTASTVSPNLVTNGSFETTSSNPTGLSGWSAKVGATDTQGTNAVYGTHDLDSSTTTSQFDGVKYPITLTSGHKYVLTFFAKLVSAGTWSGLDFGYSPDGTTTATGEGEAYNFVGGSITNATAANGGWFRETVAFTPGASSGTPYIYADSEFAGTAHEFQIDGVELEDITSLPATGSPMTTYNEGSVQLVGPITSPLTIQGTGNTADLQVLGNDDSTDLVVDSLHGVVGIGTATPQSKLQVQSGATNNISTYSVIRGVATILDQGDGGTAGQTLNLLSLENTTTSAFTSTNPAVLVNNEGIVTIQGYTPVAGAGGGTNAGTSFSVTGAVGQAGASGTFLGGSGGAIVLQGGAGGASTGTAANSNGGDITLTGGAAGTGGSGTAGTGGNVTIDTGAGTPSGTQIEDKTFESTTEHMQNWFGLSSVVQSVAQAHLGTHSLAVTENAVGWATLENYETGVVVTPGHKYAFSGWARANTTAESLYFAVVWNGGSGNEDNWGNVTDTTAGWTQVTGTLVAPAYAPGSSTEYADIAIGNHGSSGVNGHQQYFDDITVTDLGTVTSPAISIGATNAQTLTIGNENEGGYTNLFGGSDGIQLQTANSGTIAIGSINPATIDVGATGGTASDDNVHIADSIGADQAISIGGNATTGGSSAGTTVQLQGGQTSETVANAGDTIQTFTNSTTAFQVQDAAGATIMAADTSNDLLVVTGGITVGFVAAPATAPTLALSGTAGTESSATYYYEVTYVSPPGLTSDGAGETSAGPFASIVDTTTKQINLTNIPTGPAGEVTERIVYRTISGGSSGGPYYVDHIIADDTTTAWTDDNSDATLTGLDELLGSNTNTTGYFSDPQGEAGSEVFGLGASADSQISSTAFGFDANSYFEGVAVGNEASATSSGGVAVGYTSQAGNSGTAIGFAAGAGISGTAVGSGATAGTDSLSLGDSAVASSNTSIALGAGATTTATNQLVIGADNGIGAPISSVYIGNGVTDLTPLAVTVQGTGGLVGGGTSNIAGANVTLAGGVGTGTGNGGTINFETAKPSGSSGNTANTLAVVASLSGINGAALFKNSVNSTTAFQIQNASATNTLFSVNTFNLQVTIGSGATGEANPVLLVLDNGTTAADPAEVNGAMYYNTTKNSFRCGWSSSFHDCTGLENATVAQSGNNGAKTSATSFGQPYTIPTGDCQTGVVYNVTAGGYFTLSTLTSTASIALDENGVALLSDNSAEFTAADFPTNYVVGTNYEWSLNATITCYSSTTVMVTSSVSYGAPAANETNTGDGAGLTTTKAWANGANLDVMGWFSIGTGTNLIMNQFNVQRLGG
jgi:hypothetical protein